MSIEEMIKNGASPEEINAAMQEIYLEKERADRARAEKESFLRKLAEQEQSEARAEAEAHKEMLKREARAYLINAMLAYIEAFDVLPEGEEIDESDIEALEQLIIKAEELLPLYYQIAKLQNEMYDDLDNEDENPGLGLFGGLFGGGL